MQTIDAYRALCKKFNQPKQAADLIYVLSAFPH